MSEEVRVTDEKTGGQKGTKLARFSLVPWSIIWEVAEHFGRGARKYGDIEVDRNKLITLCNCENLTATLVASTTLMDSVDLVTKKIFDIAIQSLPKSSVRTVDPGARRILIVNEQAILLIAKQFKTQDMNLKSTETGQNTDLLQNTANNYFLNVAVSALSAETNSEQGDQISITITEMNLREDLFALVATRALDSSETRPKLYGKHLPTCLIHRLVSRGGKIILPNSRNWEKGYNWSYSYDALHRHLTAFWNGDNIDHDPSLYEDGEPHTTRHIIAVAWHALVLAYFSRYNVGTDDRPHLGESPSE